MTRGGKVPASYFMDDLDLAPEGTQTPPGRRATAMKIVAGTILAIAFLATVAMTVYYKDEVIPKAQDFAKYQDYFTDFFTWKKNKKYVVEMTRNRDGTWLNWITNLIKGKKKYNVKFTRN